MSWWGFKPYVSVAQRKAKAAKRVAQMAKKGRAVSPVRIDGRTIARTFWGKAWCDHLESFSDFANRLPRGRTYVRNGSVVDLQIAPGKVTALVSGSDLYEVAVTIGPLKKEVWGGVKARCAGQIGSVIELLQGRLSNAVMEVITCRDGGLFPHPVEIKLRCSCPDYAGMCKHVAAVLYGVGARLDEQPELLFTLRNVDHLDLIEQAGNVGSIAAGAGKGGDAKTIASAELADVFGIEMDASSDAAPSPSGAPSVEPTRGRRRPVRAGVAPAPPAAKAKRATAAKGRSAKSRPEPPATRRRGAARKV